MEQRPQPRAMPVDAKDYSSKFSLGSFVNAHCQVARLAEVPAGPDPGHRSRCGIGAGSSAT